MAKDNRSNNNKGMDMDDMLMERLLKDRDQHMLAKPSTEGKRRVTKEEAMKQLDKMLSELPVVEAMTEEIPQPVESTQTKKGEKKMKRQQMKTPKVVYRYVPTTDIPVTGIRILWGKNGDENIAVLRNSEFVIPSGTIWSDAVQEGIATPVIMEISDPNLRVEVLHSAMEKIRVNTKNKYGEPKILIGKSVDSDRTIMYMVFLRDLVKILRGVNPSYKTPISKVTLPTFSQLTLQVKESDIDVIRLRVVDPKIHHGGKNTNDGSSYINGIRFYYETYVSEKSKEKFGKKELRLVLKDAQIRMINTISKYCISLNTFGNEAEEFCKANGLELLGCNGAIDVECLKGNAQDDHAKYRHGDIIVVPIEDFRIINISSPEGSSRCGVQLTCCDYEAATALLEEARPEHNEIGLEAKGKLFKDACAGKAYAVAEIIKATYSFQDSQMQEIKSLLFSIPKDKDRNVVLHDNPEADWYIPAYTSNFNQLNGRLDSYRSKSLFKIRTSATNHYISAHPSLLLDKLEEAYKEEYGEVVNYAIAPDDIRIKSKDKKLIFSDQVEVFKFANIGRNPLQYNGSIQEVLYLREDEDGKLIVDPDRIRAKEGKLIMSGGNITISYGFATCLNGDFDGDLATEAFSNVAQFPMWRPKDMPDIWSMVEPEVEKALTYVNDPDAYIDLQKNDYKNIIWASVAIGMFDNFARLLFTMRREQSGKKVQINGVDRICKPISTDIGAVISAQREDTIKAKKWDIDVAHIQNVMEDFTRRYAPNGKLPKGDKRPASFLLLHNSLGTVEPLDGTGMMKRFCSLIDRINKNEEIHEMDCYKTLWKSLNGIRLYKCHSDSQYWRTALYKLWADPASLFDGVGTISKTTLAKIEHVAHYLTGTSDLNSGWTFNEYKKELFISNGGSEDDFDPDEFEANYNDYLELRFNKEINMEVKFSGYRFWSSWIMGEEDSDKCEDMYGQMYDRIKLGREMWLDKETGTDTDKRNVFSKLLTVAIGNISFGSSVSKQTQEAYSLPGYAFWLMPLEDLVWVVQKVHPNNPFISRFLKKKEEEEAMAERLAKKKVVKSTNAYCGDEVTSEEPIVPSDDF